MLAHIVVSYFKNVFTKDLEAIVRFCGIGRSELVVDFFSCELAEETLAIEEGSVLDVELQVAESNSHQQGHK